MLHNISEEEDYELTEEEEKEFANEVINLNLKGVCFISHYPDLFLRELQTAIDFVLREDYECNSRSGMEFLVKETQHMYDRTVNFLDLDLNINNKTLYHTEVNLHVLCLIIFKWSLLKNEP